MDFERLGPLMDLVPYRHAARLAGLLGGARLVLDVGGGTGRIARRLRGAGARIVVADVSRGMLGRARTRGFDVVLADAAALPFRTASADAAIAVDAFHHFPAQEAAMREMARVARERIVIEEFDPASWQGRLIERIERAARFGSTFREPPRLARMAEEAGLAPRIERHSARDYALVALRTPVGSNRKG